MNIHILGIAGTMTAPLALELKEKGHQISGSDQEKIYPPISNVLKNIPINQKIDFDTIDLFIVGSSYNKFQNCRQELKTIKKLKKNYISATKYIAQNIIKNNSILVAGSYGKTTITAKLAWIFKNLDYRPSYMFGGLSLGNFPSLKIDDSPWSIVEADESINGLDTQAKFLYFNLKYLILTSTDWEHKDCYPNEKANQKAYIKLIKKIPKDGLLIANEDIDKKIVNHCPSQIVLYKKENEEAILKLCQNLKIKPNLVKKYLQNFPGLYRRFQIKEKNKIVFIDDFAQSEKRIKYTLQKISKQYPNKIIKVFFQPHASFLQHKESLKKFYQAFELASEIILSKIKFSPDISKTQRVTFSDYKNILKEKIQYLPINQDILSYYKKTLKRGDVLVHFSSGGKEGLELFNKIIHNT
jgi:UDP-N-acetylmuramate: L-alanyl-gamma-D-glutamyl-meso-diaminopimelate ligase